MFFSRRLAHVTLIGALAISSTAIQAKVSLPAIFGDHMVLQGKSKLPVWGWATPGEKITVTLAAQTATTVTQPDGTWRVDLPAVDTNSQPGTLVVAGLADKIVFTDVLVGDVWLVSGQSNMEFGIQT